MKISVKIIKENKKAKLVEDEQGRQAWVQNRSFKDGEVNKAVFEKGVAWLADRNEEKAEQKEYDESLQLVTAAWENDKAIGVDYEAEYIMISSLYHVKRVRVFFPKSQCVHVDGEWEVKGWMLAAKKAEALDKLGSGYVF